MDVRGCRAVGREHGVARISISGYREFFLAQIAERVVTQKWVDEINLVERSE